MGVHGLWDLLAPVGRRVSVETLAGKKLAIDASIWMVQFMKAMRDEKGEMTRNAHLLGFFRRICKLLFLRAKPVFVFDGATPALKRRTLASRRRHRDQAQAKIRKTAEKLLISHLKARKLEELAAELKKSGNNKKENGKGKQVEVESRSLAEQEKLDELLAKSLAAEEETEVVNGASSSSRLEEERENEDEEEEDEEMILNVTENNIDPAVLASLPPSMQLDLLVQMRERVMAENRQKYQKIKQVPEKFSELQIQSYLKTVAFRREIDQVQRIAAGKDVGGVQTSKIASESNREFIFSSNFTGDKQALANQIGSNRDNHEPSDKSAPNPKPSYPKIPSKSGISKPGNSKSGNSNPTEKDFGADVETYTDERGRVKVSRVRALGIRMTRDIQRNLDFMREFEEQERDRNPNQGNVGEVSNEKSLEISFLEGENEEIDEVFLNLVGEREIVESDESESIWEEGLVEKEGNEISDKMENDVLMEGNGILGGGVEEGNEKGNEMLMEGNNNEGDEIDEIDWEEGLVEAKEGNEISDKMENDVLMEENDILKEGFEERNEKGSETLVRENDNENCEIVSSSRKISKGSLEEEAFVQEAIRRSLGEGFEENNERENEILVRENDNNDEGDEINWEDGDCQIISLSKNERESKEVLEEEDLIQEAIKRSLDESFEEKNEEEYEILIVENNNEGKSKGVLEEEDLINVQEKNEKLTMENKNEGKSKRVLEEDELMQEAIKRSLEDFERQKHAIKPTKSINTKEAHHEQNINNQSSDKLQEIAEHPILDKPNPVKDTSADVASLSELTSADVALQDNYLLPNDFNEANLEEEISILKQEQINLGDQRRKLESHAESVSSEMFAECQELLQMFGLPYIIASTEAEAQCAFMEMNGLVDGVVTDDSDVFLFGAKNVYKNIFDDRKYVETYFMKDIESELGLNRDMLIRMAMLLGSDYTEGVSGIGIVNAIEVMRAFPEEDGLKKFREWIESPDPSILGSFDNNLNKKSSKQNNNNNSESTSNEDQDIKETFMAKHRNVSKNWHLPSTFPSELVFNAYISPQVDDSKETFSWGKPDLNLLRKLCWDKFGWNIQKADDLLQPVLKEYNKHETQLRLEAFYTFNERFAKIRSQRIKKAIKGITGNIIPDLEDPQKDKNEGESSSHGRTKTKKKVQKNVSQKGKVRKRKNSGAKQENVQELDCSNSSSEDLDKNESQNGINMTELRRSKRQRKEVKYTEEETETGDFENLSHFELDSNDEIDQETEEQESNLTNENDKIGQKTGENETNLTNENDKMDQDIEEKETNLTYEDCNNNTNNSEGEANCSRDYLFSGGGFCTYEGNGEGNPGNEIPDLAGEESAEPGNEIPDFVEDVNDGLSVGGKEKPVLSAMPSLKRRKRL
ncbi:hypothetical protein LUZ60_003722 [Juncus effusus]|nr:hypothetical protein LUZ60_003722 [Juncus effusus]